MHARLNEHHFNILSCNVCRWTAARRGTRFTAAPASRSSIRWPASAAPCGPAPTASPKARASRTCTSAGALKTRPSSHCPLPPWPKSSTPGLWSHRSCRPSRHPRPKARRPRSKQGVLISEREDLGAFSTTLWRAIIQHQQGKQMVVVAVAIRLLKCVPGDMPLSVGTAHILASCACTSLRSEVAFVILTN